MCIAISLGFCWMMSSSSATVLGNMVGKVTKGVCVGRGGHWSVGGVSESDMRGGGHECYGGYGEMKYYGFGVVFLFWELFLFGAGCCQGMDFWWRGQINVTSGF